MVKFLVQLNFFNRPHDRVPLKEMKADWKACLDNKVGFKVRCRQPLLKKCHGSVVRSLEHLIHFTIQHLICENLSSLFP